jgi:transposase
MLYHAFGVSGVKYLATDYSGAQVIFHAEMTNQCLQYPKCSGLHFKFRGKRVRRLHMIPIGRKPCFLNLILHRVECKACSYLYWPVLPFMPESKRMTRAFIRMARELLAFGTIKDVANFLGVGWDTIKRIHKEHLQRKYRKIPLEDIEYISIDEFSIKKGHNYMTVVTDVASGAIIHAVEGRKKEDIRPFFLELKKSL